MINLLRKSKPTTKTKHVNKETPPAVPPKEYGSGLLQHFSSSSIRNHRKSRVDLSTAVESEQSAAARQKREEQRQKHRSITNIRRLVRKASTFNLHTRHRDSPQQDLHNLSRNKYLFPDVDEEVTRSATPTEELKRASTSSTVYSEAAETILHCSHSVTDDTSIHSQITTATARRHTLPARVAKPLDDLIVRTPQEILKAQEELVARYPTYTEKDHSGWAKMAHPSAEPPLSFDKMKAIAVEACDSALSGSTSYDHSKTESWNTTIINTILAQLVGESTGTTSTAASSTTQPQSKWKFVVNSTIIQHKSNSDLQSGNKGGRRGMHSAAGAYWNNEKDGMWSYKYEAADRVGLDVVVGIVWVWVG